MTISECLPSSKSDVEALAYAKKLGYPALNEVLPQLLEWLQDLNWPVARPVAALLSDAGPEIVPHIQNILSSNDDTWKYWLLSELIPNLKSEIRQALRESLTRIALNPTKGEEEEESDVLANDILAAL